MDAPTAATLLGFAGVAVALFAYLATFKRDLRADIAGVESRFDSKLGQLGAKFDQLDTKLDSSVDRLEARIDRLDAKMDARLISLEDRTYDIVSRLPAAPAAR